MIRIYRVAMLFQLCWLFVNECDAQSAAAGRAWQPVFRMGLNKEAAKWGKGMSLNEFLSRNAEYNAGDHGCFLKISLFYFRVNGLGAVDSVYARGGLNDALTATVKANILETAGKWEMPKNTRSSDQCWFIFPFVDPGRTRSCSEQQHMSRNALEELLRLYAEGEPATDRRGRVMLPPNAFPQYGEK